MFGIAPCGGLAAIINQAPFAGKALAIDLSKVRDARRQRRVDVDAVRTTRDIDLLVRRGDLPAARVALEAGFIYHHVLNVHTFVDGPQGRPSGGVHLLFAGEKVRPSDEYPLPDVAESQRAVGCHVIALEALVRMKLIACRRKDQVHLLDLIGVGLIDATWPARLPPPLRDRLQHLLDDPNG